MAACSQLPPEYDPITQTGNAKRAVMGWFGYDEPAPPDVEPPPAQGRPIPNLGTVPPPPFVTASQREQRQKDLAALQADRAAAAKADANLRAQTPAAASSATQPPAPPTPVASAPLPSPPATTQPSTPPAAESASAAAAETPAEKPSVAPNLLPPELLNATPEGAGPAPIIELPVAPNSGPAVATGVLTTSQRHGTVSFARDSASVSAAGRNTLDAAAAAALENDGRVRLVPAQSDSAPSAPALSDQRTKALREALAGTGLPADRVTIGEDGARRVDAYEVFVDY